MSIFNGMTNGLASIKYNERITRTKDIKIKILRRNWTVKKVKRMLSNRAETGIRHYYEKL